MNFFTHDKRTVALTADNLAREVLRLMDGGYVSLRVCNDVYIFSENIYICAVHIPPSELFMPFDFVSKTYLERVAKVLNGEVLDFPDLQYWLAPKIRD